MDLLLNVLLNSPETDPQLWNEESDLIKCIFNCRAEGVKKITLLLFLGIKRNAAIVVVHLMAHSSSSRRGRRAGKNKSSLCKLQALKLMMSLWRVFSISSCK